MDVKACARRCGVMYRYLLITLLQPISSYTPELRIHTAICDEPVYCAGDPFRENNNGDVMTPTDRDLLLSLSVYTPAAKIGRAHV